MENKSMVFVWFILAAAVNAYANDQDSMIIRSNEGAETPGKSSQNIHMRFPKVLDMYNEILTSVMWARRNGSVMEELAWCSQAKEDHMTRCGAKDLLDVWLQTSKAKSLPTQALPGAADDVGDIYQHNIDHICSQYKMYGECMMAHDKPATQECLSLTTIGLEIFYDYLCHSDARQELVQSGKCLARLTVNRLLSYMQMTRQTCIDPEGFSGILSLMMETNRHVWHDKHDAKQYATGLKHQLTTACKLWNGMSKCYIPAIRDLCGKSAEQFYNGLLSNMKNALVMLVKPLGETYEKYATCDMGLQNGLLGADMKTYINQQTIRLKSDYEKMIHMTCRCAGITIMFQSMFCFWKALSTAPPQFFSHEITMLDVLHHVCNPDGIGRQYIRCYQGTTESCRLAAILNITGIIEDVCAAAITARKNMACTLALTAGNKFLQKCDMTISGFVRSIMLQSDKFYRVSKMKCGSTSEVVGAPSAFPELSCINDALESTSKSSDMLEKCGQSVMDTILRGIQVLAGSPQRSEKLLGEVYKPGPPGKPCVIWKKC